MLATKSLSGEEKDSCCDQSSEETAFSSVSNALKSDSGDAKDKVPDHHPSDTALSVELLSVLASACRTVSVKSASGDAYDMDLDQVWPGAVWWGRSFVAVALKSASGDANDMSPVQTAPVR